MRRALLPSLCLLALIAGGCSFEIAGILVLAPDGTATVELTLHADEAALARLDDLEVDPTAELAAVAGQVPDWQVTREVDDEGGLAVRLVHAAPDPSAAADALRDLTAGLAEADPALLVDLDVDVDEAGAVSMHGSAGFRPPTSAGVTVDGLDVGPDAAALERATADAVDARFSLEVPGELEEHDADTSDGRRATWELVPGESRTIRAVAAAPTRWPRWLPVAAATTIAALVVGALARRRRGTRARPSSP